MFAGYSISRIVEMVSSVYAESWKNSKPRVYKGVSNYHDYRWVNVNHVVGYEAMNKILQTGKSKYDSAMWSILMAVEGEKYGFPVYFVEKALLNAALNTAPIGLIDWQEIHFPMDYMCFILPQNSLKRGDKDIAYIEISKSDVGEKESNVAPFKSISEKPALLFSVVTTDGGGFSRLFGQPININDAEFADDLLNRGFSTNDLKFVNSIVATTFNLIFAMCARPEYIEKGSKVGVHKKSGSEIWSPNIIGRKYAVNRSGESQGSHASPRMHWRRGHFRHQPYGVGLKETKVIWLEPTLIGAKGE